MSKPEILAGLDIGSGQLACVIGKRMPENDHVEIIAAARQSCRGLKGGVVINIDETALAIGHVVEAAEEMAKESVRDLIVGIRGAHIQTFNHHGAINIARTDKEITTDDVQQVIESTKAVPISTDREIIHVIPQDFVLDRQQGVPNPVGMEGSLLEVEVHIVTAGSSHLNNIWRSINNGGFGIREPVYGLLALGDVVVTQEEKDLGCLLIDLGGATTRHRGLYRRRRAVHERTADRHRRDHERFGAWDCAPRSRRRSSSRSVTAPPMRSTSKKPRARPTAEWFARRDDGADDGGRYFVHVGRRAHAASRPDPARHALRVHRAARRGNFHDGARRNRKLGHVRTQSSRAAWSLTGGPDR